MQVSNVEVYYRAVSFYLEQHPDLLVDLLKVCTSGLPMPCSPEQIPNIDQLADNYIKVHSSKFPRLKPR